MQSMRVSAAYLYRFLVKVNETRSGLSRAGDSNLDSGFSKLIHQVSSCTRYSAHAREEIEHSPLGCQNRASVSMHLEHRLFWFHFCSIIKRNLNFYPQTSKQDLC